MWRQSVVHYPGQMFKNVLRRQLWVVTIGQVLAKIVIFYLYQCRESFVICAIAFYWQYKFLLLAVEFQMVNQPSSTVTKLKGKNYKRIWWLLCRFFSQLYEPTCVINNVSRELAPELILYFAETDKFCINKQIRTKQEPFLLRKIGIQRTGSGTCKV